MTGIDGTTIGTDTGDAVAKGITDGLEGKKLSVGCRESKELL